ncbi:MAG: ribosome-associated translation inhibitor RaiA [Aestuariivita sp.]|nr:ribosome-associated translation inhibitor RaiA [Aestuariivita sp.]MCY4201653.1 ribosome-associated translation inhibitor RaiA [Aestuariivita sp.]MCY4287919.1 ribosome-associated translation inhibitor RaiA [Aestuariivita sp.]MCY4348201.1 ribosome-associated translation inhibitor RaiA [Aestuariivita sp.]
MHYQITGRQIDIGTALRKHVESELEVVIRKYAERPTKASVIFSRLSHEFVCETSVHMSTGLTAQAKAHATEIYAAFDQCREKMETQLRRYRRRLKDHHRRRTRPVEHLSASSYVLAADQSNEDEEPDSLQPIIIAEMETKIPVLSVGEAVMQMELSGDRMLIFRSEKTDTVNVVYFRDDGNIGWIDPDNKPKHQ